MSWFFFALVCAFAYGTEGVYVKGILRRLDEYLVVWGMFFFGLPWVLLPLVLKGPCGSPDGVFWVACLGAVFGNALGFTLYVKAIKFTDVSLAVPILSLSPVLLLFTSFFMLREVPSAGSIAGVVLVTAGCYMLPVTQKGLLEPFRMIAKDRGCRYALMTVAVWSIVANIDKVAINHSSAYIYPPVFHAMFSVLFLPFVISRVTVLKEDSNMKKMAGMGLIHAVLMLSHMMALRSTMVPYVIAVKRSGMIVSVILSYFLLKEKNAARRLGASFMIASGLALILLF